MTSMGYADVLGNHADNPAEARKAGISINVQDREWTVSPAEARLIAQFETYVRKKARQAVLEIEREEGPIEGRKALSAFLAMRTAGHYTWGQGSLMGEGIADALANPRDFAYLFMLLLRRCHPAEFPDDATGLDKASELLNADYGQCIGAVRESLGNLQAPKNGAKTDLRTLD